MNLSDFEMTTYSGLYVSKEAHVKYGKKYITRFQHDKKRYVKVLGYSIRDKMSVKNAFDLMQKFKDTIIVEPHETIIEKAEEKIVVQEKKVSIKDNAELVKLKEENDFFKSILGDYQKLKPEVLAEGIQKIHDLEALKKYQIELIKLQNFLEKGNKRMIILFEGRDASGKGGAIRRITRYMNNKHYRIVALGKPDDTQRNQWFLQRYIEHFPTGGEIVMFDRSWYNRAMVEPVFGFCTEDEYKTFMRSVQRFEEDLVDHGFHFLKIYLSVSKEEQARRFAEREENPLKQWKLSEIDMQMQSRWKEFTQKKYDMLKYTNTETSPWTIIRSDSKFLARLNSIKVILNSIDYEGKDERLDFTVDNDIVITAEKELELMGNKRVINWED